MTPDRPSPEGASGGPGLIATLGFFSTIMLVVGGVIGSGIFRKGGVMMNELGSPALLLGVWALAGFITLLGVLSNAELAGTLPGTGGQYLYLHRIFGPFAGFLFGWGAFVVIQTGSIAALAYVFAEYSTHFFRLPDAEPALAGWTFHLPFIGDIAPFRELGVKAVAVSVIVILTVVNYLGATFGAAVQNAFTVAKLLGMAVLVVLVFLPGSGGGAANFTAPASLPRKEGLALLAAIVAGLQGAFWAYDGWVKVSFIAGEVRDSQRTLPRALIFGMLIVTGIYLTMSAAYCWALPADAMAKSRLVAADAAERILPDSGRWIALLVMISTFGANNAVVLTSARVYYSMARKSAFPPVLGRAHPRFHTPSAALLAQGVWGVALVFSGTFDMLTDTLIFVAWIFYGMGALGVILLRRKEPNIPRKFKVPGYPFVPAAFVFFAAVFLALTVYNDINAYRAAVAAGKPALINSAFGAFLVLLGTPIYFLYRKRGHSTEMSGPPG